MVYYLTVTITNVSNDTVDELSSEVEGEINTTHIEKILCYDGNLRKYLVNVRANTSVLSASVRYLLVKSLKKLSFFFKNHITSGLIINKLSLSTELDAIGEFSGDSIDIYAETSYYAINKNHTGSARASVPAKNINVKTLAITISNAIINSYSATTGSCWGLG
jgi:hypothetical protein